MPGAQRILAVLVVLGVLCVLPAHAGIPEPGITLYGKVFDQAGRLTTEGTVTWTYFPSAGTNDTITVVTELRQLDGQDDTFSYLVQIPAQTPIVGLPVQSDMLSLEETAVVYQREATYGQTDLAFDVPVSVSVSVTDRGTVERIDLFMRREVLGDIDGDDKITAMDVQNVINSALGMDIGGRGPLTDINGDGVIDAIDIQLTINGALGIPIDLPGPAAKADDTTVVSEEEDVFRCVGEGETDCINLSSLIIANGLDYRGIVEEDVDLLLEIVDEAGEAIDIANFGYCVEVGCMDSECGWETMWDVPEGESEGEAEGELEWDELNLFEDIIVSGAALTESSVAWGAGAVSYVAVDEDGNVYCYEIPWALDAPTASGVPVTGMLGLGLIAAAFALGGAVTLRKK